MPLPASKALRSVGISTTSRVSEYWPVNGIDLCIVYTVPLGPKSMIFIFLAPEHRKQEILSLKEKSRASQQSGLAKDWEEKQNYKKAKDFCENFTNLKIQ